MSLVTPHRIRWIVQPRDRKTEEKLRHDFSVAPLVATILSNRGFTDPLHIDTFLNPSLENLHNPSLLPDFSTALDCILEAKNKKELIFIHGDYDVDGVTSTALLTRFLRNIGCSVFPHVPHRIKEGYGIHPDAVHHAHKLGAKLFLTCDCGVKAHEQIASAREMGMKVVVTDHHEVGDMLPMAHAVINPHRKDSLYPFKHLCGAGIVFKLCEGITRELNIDVAKYHRAYLDLAAIGTIADIVPLYGENRIIVKHGLKRIPTTQKEGLKALLEVAHNGSIPAEELKAAHVGFRIGPRLNAVGRIDDAAHALALLLENEIPRSRELALHLDGINQLRRKEQQRSFEEAVEQVLSKGLNDQHVIVISNSNWHPGIIGLVASKLVEHFYRPSFVISEDQGKGIGKGSARTIPGFHLANCLHKNQHLFLACGGHEMAAGFAVELPKIDIIQKELNEYAAQILKFEDLCPSIHIDAEVEMEETNYVFTEELSKLEPFGASNNEPLFLTKNLKIEDIQSTSNPDHCRVILRNTNGETRYAMAFGLGNRLERRYIGKSIDVVFTTHIDTFNGKSSLKWFIKDFRDS